MRPPRVKPSRIQAANQRGKRSKHGNVKCEYDGYKFDSIKERERYKKLRLMEKAGAIHSLQMQVRFKLVDAAELDGRRKPAVVYIADFVYVDPAYGKIVEDVKSPITRKDKTYRLKRHMMKAFMGIEVVEIM